MPNSTNSDSEVLLLSQQIKALQEENVELTKRVRIQETFLDDRLRDIPDYNSLFQLPTEDLYSIIHSWIIKADIWKLRGALVYVTEFNTSDTRLLILALEDSLSFIEDEKQYFDTIEEVLKFPSINFTRVISDTNIAKRHLLSDEGVKRFNSLIPILLRHKGKFNHVFAYLADNEQYISAENRSLVLSHVDKATNPNSIEALFSIIGKLDYTQLLDICLQREGTAYCFLAIKIIKEHIDIFYNDIRRISKLLNVQGPAGRIASLVLLKQTGKGLCPVTSQKRIWDGDYYEFTLRVQQYELDIENKRKLQEAYLLEGTMMEFRLAAKLMHHYMFMSQDSPLLGLLPRQCIDNVPSEKSIKRYHVLKVMPQFKLMILAEESDMTYDALSIPLLNIGDEVEVKFTCPKNTLIPEVAECRLANVKISNMPHWLDYKVKHYAVVVSQESFIDYTLKLISK